MNLHTRTVLATCLLSVSALTWAGATDQEVARLGKDLTPVGAERAASKDGSIPEWSGGITTAPAGWKGGQKRIDPFKDDKPLYSIDATNAD